jgi:hypothetical protein
VVEVDPGSPAVDAAGVLDRMVLVASPELAPALAAAVADTIAAAPAPAPAIVVNRAVDDTSDLAHADVLVPDSRVGARMALAGRMARGPLRASIEQLADLCAAA